MIVVQKQSDGSFKDITAAPCIQFDDVVHPANIASLWLKEDLAAIGVTLFDDPVAPEGMTLTGYTIEAQDGAPIVVPKTEKAAAPLLGFLDFIALFTPAEQQAVFASTDLQTKIFVAMATGSGGMHLDDPRVVSGVNYLATGTTATPPGPGLLTAARAAQILAGEAPPAA